MISRSEQKNGFIRKANGARVLKEHLQARLQVDLEKPPAPVSRVHPVFKKLVIREISCISWFHSSYLSGCIRRLTRVASSRQGFGPK
jgi:hypothetical protein